MAVDTVEYRAYGVAAGCLLGFVCASRFVSEELDLREEWILEAASGALTLSQVHPDKLTRLLLTLFWESVATLLTYDLESALLSPSGMSGSVIKASLTCLPVCC